MKKTFRDCITVLGGSGFARGIALLNSVIIARFLGPERFGVFSIFYVVMILVWLLPSAFDTTFVRYAKTSNHDAEKKNFLKIAVFLKLTYASLVLLISYPLSYFLASCCLHKPEMKNFLIAAMSCGVFLSFLRTVASTFQEKEKFMKFAGLHAFYSTSIFFVLIASKVLGLCVSLEGVVLIFLVISITVGIFSIVHLFRKVGRLLPLNIDAFKTSFSLGKWIFGATCLYYTFQRIDTLFLAKYVEFTSVGIYFVAIQITMVISLITASLSAVFLPKASQALESKNSLKNYAKESFVGIALINTFIVLLMLLAPFLIKMLYGNEYLSASPMLKILLIGWFLYVIYLPFSFLFYAFNDSKTKFLLEVLKFSVAAILLYCLVPFKGGYGAACAMTIALCLNTIVSLWVLKARIEHSPLIKDKE